MKITVVFLDTRGEDCSNYCYYLVRGYWLVMVSHILTLQVEHGQFEVIHQQSFSSNKVEIRI